MVAKVVVAALTAAALGSNCLSLDCTSQTKKNPGGLTLPGVSLCLLSEVTLEAALA